MVHTCNSVIPALGRVRQDNCECKGSLPQKPKGKRVGKSVENQRIFFFLGTDPKFGG
jgi:hypothetical protein